MKKLLLIISSIIFLYSCTDDRNAKRILENNGYTNVRLTGYNMFCCGKDDSFSTGFKAISPAGKEVSGCVCSSLFSKGGTIRFD